MGNIDKNIEQNIRQGYMIREEAAEHYNIPVSDLEHIEPCPHPREKIRVLVIVEECSECGRQFHHRIISPNRRLQSVIVQIHQGLIDAETVIDAGDYTEEEQKQLRAAWEGHCEHEQIEPYECSCSQKVRYRCKACARVWDTDPQKVEQRRKKL